MTYLLKRRLERRTFLRGIVGTAGLAAASTLLTACSGGTSGARSTNSVGKTAPAAGAGAAASSTSKLEMFSWWTSGGEAAGLSAMYSGYRKTHPNVQVVNQA